MFGCTEAKPCRYYPFEKFMEDWGPNSGRGGFEGARITRSRSCGSGVLLTVDYGKNQEKLWVERQDMSIGFPPVQGLARRGSEGGLERLISRTGRQAKARRCIWRSAMGTTTAGLEGIIAGESEICYIDGYLGILSYRGFNIHTLADNASFEEVIFLLWNGWLPKTGGTRSVEGGAGGGA